MPRRLSLARFQVLAAAVLFSTGGAAIKATALTAWQVASFRSGMAALALLVLLPAARRRPDRREMAVGVAYAATLILYVLANKLTTAANTIFLQSTAPLYILVLGPWLLKERLRRSDIALMVAVVAGMSLFFVEGQPAQPTAPDPLRGNVLALLAGVFWALSVMGLRWMSRGDGRSAGPARVREGGAARAVVAGNVIACLACLPWALPVSGAGASDWLLIAYMGVVQVGLAYVFLTAGLARVPAFEASLLLFLEPVLNPIWAWWIHGETPAGWALVGGAIILTATLAKALGGRRAGAEP